MCWCVRVCVRSHVPMHTPTLTLLYPHPVLRDYHYSRANKPVPLETPEPLNIMDKYLGDEFAGTPLELAEDDKTSLVDSDKELLGQLAAAVTLAVDTLCVSPDVPEPGAEAEAEAEALRKQLDEYKAAVTAGSKRPASEAPEPVAHPRKRRVPT